MTKLFSDRGMIGSLVLAIVSVLSLAAAAWATGPVGLDAIEQFDQVSVLRQGVRIQHYSSHDPTGRNDDNNSYLGRDGDEAVLLDVRGPGCIYRIWFTTMSFQDDGLIRIYFDHQTTPTVQMTLNDFFEGLTAPFLAPLVGDQLDSSGGYYCYVPMPFREGCKITHTNALPGRLNYHNISFHRYPSAEGVTTFTGNESTAAARAVWNAAGSDPKIDQGNTVLTGMLDIAGYVTATLADISGAGTIARVEFNIPGMTESMLDALRLRIWWDDAPAPAVDAPVGMFFGSGLAPTTVAGLALGMDGSRLYCYFPMPFATRALVKLVNTGSATYSNINYTVRYTPRGIPANGVGIFHAQYRRDPHPTPNEDYILIEETGGGHVVGVVQNFHGYGHSVNYTTEWYMEGDERIYIDGSATPAIYGTGVEDFYNGGWYFFFGAFSLPVHGNPIQIHGNHPSHACYRFFLSDPIPFTDGIRFGMEHGGWNQFDADFESVTFYYKAPQALSVSTDELNVGHLASETAHGYQTTGAGWSGSSQLAYEGDHDNVLITDNGRRLAIGGTSEFTITVQPADNAGVLLRRRLDYRLPRQRAQVFVDGTLAGTWYDAGSNTFFADSEFLVPEVFTQGKQQITVRIVNTSTESEWTEYYYWARTLTPVILSTDFDGDGVDSPGDNCPLIANPGQEDTDDDGVGDACDSCPGTPSGWQVDADGCSPPVPGDFDADYDVDQADFGRCQACLTGQGRVQSDPDCKPARLDADPDVDEIDVAIFIGCMSGPNVVVDPDCADQ